MPKKNDDDYYGPGNPEYDFWNDKNLYPDLRNDYDDCGGGSKPGEMTGPSDTKVGGGTVFLTVFGWLFLMAPLALFFTWEDWIIQVVFWGGAAIVMLLVVMWFWGMMEGK